MEPQKTTIDGFSFELNQLPGWTGFDVFGRLLQTLGPAIGPLQQLMVGKKKGEKVDPSDAIGGLIKGLRGTDMTDVIALAKVLLTDCIISGDLPNGKKLAKLSEVYDEAFRGKQMTQLKLMIWAIQVNFSSFFDDLKIASPSLNGQAPTSMSPKTSEGGGRVAG